MTTAWQWSMLRTGCPNPQVQHLQRKMATPMHATCAPRGRGLAPPHAPCPGRAPWCSLPANCGPRCRALLFFVVRPKRTKTAWTATDMAPSCVPKHPGRKTAWTATDKAPSRVSRRTKAAKNASDMAPSCGPMRKHKDSVDRHVLGAVAIWAQAPRATIEMQYKGKLNTRWVGNDSAGTRPDTLGPRRPLLSHTAALGHRSSVFHVTYTRITVENTNSGGQGDS